MGRIKVHADSLRHALTSDTLREQDGSAVFLHDPVDSVASVFGATGTSTESQGIESCRELPEPSAWERRDETR